MEEYYMKRWYRKRRNPSWALYTPTHSWLVCWIQIKWLNFEYIYIVSSTHAVFSDKDGFLFKFFSSSCLLYYGSFCMHTQIGILPSFWYRCQCLFCTFYSVVANTFFFLAAVRRQQISAFLFALLFILNQSGWGGSLTIRHVRIHTHGLWLFSS